MAALTALATVVAVSTGCGRSGEAASADHRAQGSAAGDPAGAGRLPTATTHSVINAAPRDTAHGHGHDWPGLVVRPTRTVTVHAAPEGAAVAELPAAQLDGPTWVPVVEETTGWYRVLLPNRPNASTGWISRTGGVLEIARSSYLVRVSLESRRLVLLRSGRPVGIWRIAVGAPATPTPAGRTFVLASLAPPDGRPSPLVLPLGTHSQTLESFGGGPGTVAFHGWPDASVFGRAVTHGCVRVPSEALRALSHVPLGTVVLIER